MPSMLKSYFKTTFSYLVLCVSVFIGLVGYAYTNKQIRDKEINKELLPGKWIYLNEAVGNVVMVFNKNGTGYRFTDSNKTVQEFKYQITRKSFLKFYIKSYKPEIYYIDSLATKTLIIREYPFKKIKESISIYESNFKKGDPRRTTLNFVPH